MSPDILAMPESMQMPPLPQEEQNLLADYDVLGGAERILGEASQDEYAGFSLDGENFGLSNEANELAYENAMALQSLDILGLLDHDTDDAESTAHAGRVMDAFNFVNLTFETVTTEGLMAEVARRSSIFNAERAAEYNMRVAREKADAEDEDDE